METEPPTPAAGEALLRITAASLNYRDFLTCQGGYGSLAPLPLTPLSCGCGVVEAVGAGVTRVAVGDRVTPIFHPTWISGPPRGEVMTQSLGGGRDGVARDFMTIEAEALVPAPPHLSDAEAATLPCAGITAWRGVVTDGRVRPGDRVLVQGTGGVSIFALQFAKRAGAEVIVTSSSDERLERARGLGADHLVNYRDQPKWANAVLDATGGEGVDLVVEVGGAGTLQQSLKCLKMGGHVAVIGVLSGAVDDLRIFHIIGRAARLQGVACGNRDDMEAMARAIALSRLRPVVSSTRPFSKLPEALADFGRGGHFGKVVIDYDA